MFEDGDYRWALPVLEHLTLDEALVLVSRAYREFLQRVGVSLKPVWFDGLRKLESGGFALANWELLSKDAWVVEGGRRGEHSFLSHLFGTAWRRGEAGHLAMKLALFTALDDEDFNGRGHEFPAVLFDTFLTGTLPTTSTKS
jgi:hypothetical protein